MKNVREFIDSGILEMYLLQNTSPEETREVEAMAEAYPEVKKEIEDISLALEEMAMQQATQPGETVKPFLLATVNYVERMQNGEAPSFPPVLSDSSRIQDYSEWLNREDMRQPMSKENLSARIISHAPGLITAIVWIRYMAPSEVHHDEFEKFLIVEGTCNIVIEEKTHALVPGDYLQIPLHQAHRVQVTSTIPCKVILQRVAA